MPVSNRLNRSSRRALASLAAAAALLLAPTTGSALVLQQLSPGAITYTDVDYRAMLYSGVGDVTADVTAVDVQLGLGNTNTSGCEASDFAGFAAGNIALLQRGFCTFQLKAENARAAGAVGVLIFNQGDTADPSRTDAYTGTLSELFLGQLDTMVFGLSYDLGALLVTTSGLVMRMQATLTDPGVRPPVVPNPATLSLVALGLLVGAALRRRG